jgi:hypothetical protein
VATAAARGRGTLAGGAAGVRLNAALKKLRAGAFGGVELSAAKHVAIAVSCETVTVKTFAAKIMADFANLLKLDPAEPLTAKRSNASPVIL